MVINYKLAAGREAVHAFTLMEVVISIFILAMVLSGLIYGYVQINRNAEWNSLSLIGQSYATEYVEQARAAQWNSQQTPSTNGPTTSDQLLCPTNYTLMDTNYSPTGQSLVVTTTVRVTDLSTNNVSIRQIRADSSWVFPLTGTAFSNTVVTQRAPDQ